MFEYSTSTNVLIISLCNLSEWRIYLSVKGYKHSLKIKTLMHKILMIRVESATDSTL